MKKEFFREIATLTSRLSPFNVFFPIPWIYWAPCLKESRKQKVNENPENWQCVIHNPFLRVFAISVFLKVIHALKTCECWKVTLTWRTEESYSELKTWYQTSTIDESVWMVNSQNYLVFLELWTSLYLIYWILNFSWIYFCFHLIISGTISSSLCNLVKNLEEIEQPFQRFSFLKTYFSSVQRHVRYNTHYVL